jgi:hypothetical protein
MNIGFRFKLSSTYDKPPKQDSVVTISQDLTEAIVIYDVANASTTTRQYQTKFTRTATDQVEITPEIKITTRTKIIDVENGTVIYVQDMKINDEKYTNLTLLYLNKKYMFDSIDKNFCKQTPKSSLPKDKILSKITKPDNSYVPVRADGKRLDQHMWTKWDGEINPDYDPTVYGTTVRIGDKIYYNVPKGMFS